MALKIFSNNFLKIVLKIVLPQFTYLSYLEYINFF